MIYHKSMEDFSIVLSNTVDHAATQYCHDIYILDGIHACNVTIAELTFIHTKVSR